MRRVILLLPAMAALAACSGGSSSSPGAPSAPAAAAPAPAPATTLPAADPSPTPAPASVTLRRASIVGANGHAASGTALIIRDGNSFRLELGDDFRIDSGNTDVYLARENVVDNRDLNLGELTALSGRQSYPLADDGGRYGKVVLWCRPFRVPIGVGDLN